MNTSKLTMERPDLWQRAMTLATTLTGYTYAPKLPLMSGARTWHVENAVVAAVLLAVWALTGRRAVELVGACAVFAGFCHASIAERMREREAARPVPSVECHRKATWFFLAKELGWLVYFVAMGAWSALVGVGVFLAYPAWRRLWRHMHPIHMMTSEELLARIKADT